MLKLLSLMLVFTLLSCGKKAQEKNEIQEVTTAKSEGRQLLEASRSIQEAIQDNNSIEARKLYLDYPDLDLNYVYENGETLLTTAIRLNQLESLEFLLNKPEVDINKPNINSETPIMVAAKRGREGIVKRLMTINAKLDEKDSNGDTALLLAIKNYKEGVALDLIQGGANIHITNNQNINAFKLAETKEITKVIEKIKTALKLDLDSPDEGTFIALISQGDASNLNTMLSKFPLLIHKHEHLNPFVLAMKLDSDEKAMAISEVLLENEASIDGPKGAETTPLITAIKLQKMNFADFFLTAQADVERRDKEGKTALMWAVELNNWSMVKILVENYRAERLYRTKVNGKEKTFNACSSAREIKSKVKTPAEKKDIQAISNLLRNGIFGCWL